MTNVEMIEVDRKMKELFQPIIKYQMNIKYLTSDTQDQIDQAVVMENLAYDEFNAWFKERFGGSSQNK